MSRFLAPRLREVVAYTPGEQPQDRRYIKLNTNESPYPPSPEVLAALRGGAWADLRLYPDPAGRLLVEKLAAHYGVAPDEVFLANGSDDILNVALWAFGSEGVRYPAISYSFYPVTCRLHGLEARPIPLRPDFSIDPADYEGGSGMVVIANPNAPTGIALRREELRRILEANREQVVLIDEAYVDFGAESAVPLLGEFENLLVVMTFSKSRSLAGARLGFALGAPALIDDLNRLKFSTNPYSVSRPNLLAGAAAMDSNAYFAEKCERIIATREKTVVELEKLGFAVLPSRANFVFAAHDRAEGGRLYEALKARGILIRHFADPAIARYVRITIGTEEEMDVLLQAIRAVLEEEGENTP